jgi:hypothetical protein
LLGLLGVAEACMEYVLRQQRSVNPQGILIL